MVAWTMVPCDKKVAPQARDMAGFKEALATVQAHLSSSKYAHKERVDLAALAVHSGNKYTQVEMIPDTEFAALRDLQGTFPLVLLPPGTADASVVGSDAVVIFYDLHGGVKGLPFNERASMICTACGLKRQVRGDCFLGRLIHAPPSEQIELGAEVAPQMIVERDWLEAAQRHNAAGGEPCQLQGLLAGRLSEARRQKVAAAVAGATSLSVSPSSVSTVETVAVETTATAEGNLSAAAQPSAAASAGAAGQLSWEDGQDEVTVRVDLPAGIHTHVHARARPHTHARPQPTHKLPNHTKANSAASSVVAQPLRHPFSLALSDATYCAIAP